MGEQREVLFLLDSFACVRVLGESLQLLRCSCGVYCCVFNPLLLVSKPLPTGGTPNLTMDVL